MTSFEPQNKIITKIKLYGTNTETQIVDVNAWDDIDVCCSEAGKVDTEKLLKEIDDTVPRIGCDISREDFLEKYVKRKEPVVIVNCSQD